MLNVSDLLPSSCVCLLKLHLDFHLLWWLLSTSRFVVYHKCMTIKEKLKCTKVFGVICKYTNVLQPHTQGAPLSIRSTFVLAQVPCTLIQALWSGHFLYCWVINRLTCQQRKVKYFWINFHPNDLQNTTRELLSIILAISKLCFPCFVPDNDHQQFVLLKNMIYNPQSIWKDRNTMIELDLLQGNQSYLCFISFDVIKIQYGLC